MVLMTHCVGSRLLFYNSLRSTASLIRFIYQSAFHYVESCYFVEWFGRLLQEVPFKESTSLHLKRRLIVAVVVVREF